MCFVCVPTTILTRCSSLVSSFDLVTNGGIAVALHFERAPFITQEHTLWLPWGRFFVMDTIVMRHEENDIPSCDLSSFTRPSPVVSPAPLTAFAGSCSERRTVVPEIQVTPSPPHRLALCGAVLPSVRFPIPGWFPRYRETVASFRQARAVTVTLTHGDVVILSLPCNWSAGFTGARLTVSLRSDDDYLAHRKPPRHF